jgi:chromosome segregation ATPase
MQPNFLCSATQERLVAELQRKLHHAEESQALGAKVDHSASADRRIRALERENQHLKDSVENAALLREQLSQATEQLHRAQERVSRLTQMEVDLRDAREQLRVWDDVMNHNGIGGVHTPQDLLRFVADQQQKCLLVMEQLGAAKTEAKRLEGRGEELAVKLQEATKKSTLLQKRVSQLEDDNSKTEARMKIFRSDRDTMASVLESFHHDVKLQGTDLTKTLQQQNAKQQQLIEQLKERISQLEDDLGRLQSEAADRPSAPAAAPVEAEGGAARMDTGEEPAIDFDPRTSKIVHLRSNPVAWAVAERAQELHTLRTECAALRIKAKQLEQLQQDGGAAPSRGAGAKGVLEVDPQLAKELEDTRKKLENAETKNVRLKEAMNQRVVEFRKACYELFGYQIDVNGVNQFSLQPMYAERADDSLVFLSSADGMQLLETPFSHTQRENIEGE